VGTDAAESFARFAVDVAAVSRNDIVTVINELIRLGKRGGGR
jgi:hypothetical protein